jgi:hypothetical protein
MLIYGASLKGRNLVGGVVDPTIISKQSLYIERLIKERAIRPPNEKSTNFFTITLNNEVICYLFSFGTLSIMRMDRIIYEYIENCKDFSKWRTMVNCYTP